LHLSGNIQPAAVIDSGYSDEMRLQRSRTWYANGKATFFESLGFRRVEPEVLAKAFQNVARQAEVARVTVSPHGRKYVIVGEIESPIGKAARVQTIWIVDKGSDLARLVTAYP
jgi:hypothetical protein